MFGHGDVVCFVSHDDGEETSGKKNLEEAFILIFKHNNVLWD